MYNTIPCNPFPISSEQLHKCDNEDLQSQINAINDVIAPEFDAEAGTYEIGDKVMYDGKLYEFTSAHETAGEWNPTEVTDTTVGDELSSLESGLTNVDARLDAVESAIKTYTSKQQLSTQGAETLCQITVDVDPTKYMWMASINSGDGDNYVSFLTISAIYTQSNNNVIVVISQKARDSYSSSYINVNLVGIRKG